MSSQDTTIVLPADLKALNRKYAAYDHAEQARVAVKLLTNSGFTAEQLFVLCTDKTRSEEFRSRLMPAGAPQLNTAPAVVGGAGAALGAAVLGGAGLTAGPAGAALGAAAGAMAGAGVGVLLGAGTYSDDETRQLIELHREALDKGQIVVVVQPSTKDKSGSSDMDKAEALLKEANTAAE